MNSRERVIAALERSGPDRVPTNDSFWDDTITRWEAEGFPKGVEPEEYFDFDIGIMGFDASPRFPAQLLAEDGEMITMRDRHGAYA